MVALKEILKRLDWRVWLCFLTIMLFFIALPVNAYGDDFSEDFESYSIGELDGQGDWWRQIGDPGECQIYDTTVYEGVQSVGCGPGGVMRYFNSKGGNVNMVDTVLDWWQYPTTDTGGYSAVSFSIGTSTYGSSACLVTCDDTILEINSNDSGYVCVLDTWNHFYFQYKSASTSNECQISLDGITWVGSDDPNDRGTIGSYYISNTNNNTVYYDDFVWSESGPSSSIEPGTLINFEDFPVEFSLGDIDGQGDFLYYTGSHLYQVNNHQSFSSPQSLKIPWGTTSFYKLVAQNAISSSTLSFWILLASDLGAGDTFQLQPTLSNGTWPFYIDFQYSQPGKWKISSNNGSDYDHFLYMTTNYWYQIFVDFDFDNNRYRIGLENSLGIWRDFKFETNEFNFYGFSVDDNNGSFYIDNMIQLPFNYYGERSTEGRDYYVDFGETAGDFSPYLEVPDKVFCWIDHDCFLKYKYNRSAVGGEVYFMDDIIGSLATSTAIASTTLTLETYPTEFFNLPNQETFVTKDYCLFLIGTSTEEYPFTERYYCGIEVLWQATSTIPEYDIDSACDGIPASSGGWDDDMRYAIECGFRKVIYWAIHPKPQTYLDLQNAMVKVTTQFPVSVWFDIDNSLNALKATSTALVVIPILPEGNELGLGGDFLHPLMLSNTFGNTWYYIYNSMVIIVYAVGFLYFIKRIMSMCGGNDDD